MNESFELDELLNRYAAGTCTRAEFDRMMFLVEKPDAGETAGDHWNRSWDSTPAIPEISAEWQNKLASMLKDSKHSEMVPAESETVPVIRPRKWIVAAAVSFFLLTGYLLRLLLINGAHDGAAPAVAQQKIYNGHERAILILADGRQISLDTAARGKVALQSGMKISKGEEGEVYYYPETEIGLSPGYNTIIVPRSGNYSVVLSDGTRVHLNAASTLRFPVSFTGPTRDVILDGEGYFEVAKNPSRPFHVKTDGFTVEVFGTHFNVKSYAEDGHSSATLVEGKVRIRKENGERSAGIFLKPSQQANLNSTGKLTLNTAPNMDEVLAWQTNVFRFANRRVSSILHDVGRWYDIPIVYRGAPPEQKLTGTFTRTTDLSQVVAMLRYAGVKLTIASDHSLIVGE